MLRLDIGFPGACLGPTEITGLKVYASLGRYREEGSLLIDGRRMDYNCSFIFGLTNTDTKPVSAQIYINCRSRPQSQATPLIYSRTSADDTFHPYPVEGAYDELAKQYFFVVTLRPHETRHFSNVMYRPLNDLVISFKRLGSATGAQPSAYGSSVLGHPLPLYHYPSRRPSAPAVLIVTGYHPMEPEWLASETIMAALASPPLRRYRDAFNFYVAPLANPDGYGLGYNACNASLVNFYWDFRYRDTHRVPEASSLYKLARRLKPLVYFDFHAYTYQQKKHPGPYLKPSYRYQGRRIRHLIRQLNRDFDRLCQHHYLYNYSAYTPSTLATILTNEFNTITFSKFHLHQAHSLEANRRLTLDSVRLVLDSLLATGLPNPNELLLSPYGKTKPSPIHRHICQVLYAIETKTHLLELLDRYFRLKV